VSAKEYGAREVRATESVLIELAQVCGAWKQAFVVIGGAVPWLLLRDAAPPHIGTIDIDLDLNPEALAEGAYASLIEALDVHGYERAEDTLKPFQLRRVVDVGGGPHIAVLLDLLKPKGAKGDKNKPTLVSGLRVIDADGAGVALRHNVEKSLAGRMPDGRQNEVRILVASIPALLVMKGYALTGRLKDKDAYDVYYSVRNYPGGIDDLSAECRKLLVLEATGPEPGVARQGFEAIASKWGSEDAFGPVTARQFLEGSSALGDMTPEQVQVDAFRQVSALLTALDLGSDG
jgi:hypothetical protein